MTYIPPFIYMSSDDDDEKKVDTMNKAVLTLFEYSDDVNLDLLEKMSEVIDMDKQIDDENNENALMKFVARDLGTDDKFIERGVSIMKGKKLMHAFDDNGDSALTYSDNSHNSAALFKQGFNANLTNKDGVTELMRQMRDLRYDNVTLLKQNGAKLDAVDSDGDDAVDWISMSSDGWKKRYKFASRVKGLGFNISKFISREKKRAGKNAVIGMIVWNALVAGGFFGYGKWFDYEDFSHYYKIKSEQPVLVNHDMYYYMGHEPEVIENDQASGKNKIPTVAPFHLAAFALPLIKLSRKRKRLNEMQIFR
ncbi:hypothetical protein LJC18_03600 [Lachnospiraceae bacterium OttesenSCG-928-E19]|nr:hypothetical protein [Lachnospiraceae bacterium OttesenSCG-928-E19]